MPQGKKTAVGATRRTIMQGGAPLWSPGLQLTVDSEICQHATAGGVRADRTVHTDRAASGHDDDIAEYKYAGNEINGVMCLVHHLPSRSREPLRSEAQAADGGAD